MAKLCALFPKKNRVIINGVNIMKRHQKARPAPGGQQIPAQIVEFEAPLDLSNVMVVCDQLRRESTRVLAIVPVTMESKPVIAKNAIAISNRNGAR